MNNLVFKSLLRAYRSKTAAQHSLRPGRLVHLILEASREAVLAV